MGGLFPGSTDIDWLRFDHTPGTDSQRKVDEYSLLIQFKLWQNDYTDTAKKALASIYPNNTSPTAHLRTKHPTLFEREMIRSQPTTQTGYSIGKMQDKTDPPFFEQHALLNARVDIEVDSQGERFVS